MDLWETFMSSGKIKDYLAYKEHMKSVGESENADNNKRDSNS